VILSAVVPAAAPSLEAGVLLLAPLWWACLYAAFAARHDGNG
jgi:hypothetical protein